MSEKISPLDKLKLKPLETVVIILSSEEKNIERRNELEV